MYYSMEAQCQIVGTCQVTTASVRAPASETAALSTGLSLVKALFYEAVQNL